MKHNLPQGWSYRPLGDIANINMGQSPESSFYNLLGEGLPLIQGNADCQNRKTVAKIFSSQITKKAFEGDIILSVRAPVGTIAICSQDSCIGRGVCAIRGKDIDHEYLKEYLIFVESQWNQFGQGSTFTAINSSDIKRFDIAIPKDKKIQNKIVEILSRWDQAIEAQKKLIEAKTHLRKGLMCLLLKGRLRLPKFSKKWTTKLIREFTDCTSGGTPNTSVAEYWGGSIRWMSSGELNKKFVEEVEGRITAQGLKNSSTKMIPKKCVLVGLAGQGKTRGTVAMNLIELCTNQSVAAIIPNDTFVSEYLYYNLDSRYDELRRLSTGDGGRGGLNLTIIKSLSIPFPDVAEQTAIASILTTCDHEISYLDKKLILLKAQKKGLMQKLLTGKIRVSNGK